MLRRCEVCREPLIGRRSDAVTCSAKCRQALQRRRRAVTARDAGGATRDEQQARHPRDLVAEQHWDRRLWHGESDPRW